MFSCLAQDLRALWEFFTTQGPGMGQSDVLTRRAWVPLKASTHWVPLGQALRVPSRTLDERPHSAGATRSVRRCRPIKGERDTLCPSVHSSNSCAKCFIRQNAIISPAARAVSSLCTASTTSLPPSLRVFLSLPTARLQSHCPQAPHLGHCFCTRSLFAVYKPP